MSITIDNSKDLLALLNHRKSAMKISADCHEYLFNTYRVSWIIFTVACITLNGATFIISALGGQTSQEQGSQPFLVLTILTGLTTIIAGIMSKWNFAEIYKSHQKSMVAAANLYQDIDFALSKTLSGEMLQTVTETYNEKIKTFRETEEPIPWAITHKFLTEQ